MATVEGDQPRVRPIGLQFIDNGKLYFAVGDFKPCYKQMTENPKVEVCGYNTKTGDILRVNGKAVFVDDAKLVEKCFTLIPQLRDIYDGISKKLVPFYLDEIHANITSMKDMVRKEIL